MKLLLLTFFAISLSLSAKINMDSFKDEVLLGSQTISIAKAEIIINKMPTIGEAKNRNYLIITLKTSDNKKIKEKHTLELVSFPSCKQNFSSKVTELREKGCIIRNLPDSARKGRLVVLHIKDAKGTVHILKATTSEMEVH